MVKSPWGKLIKRAIELASKKGLVVKKNLLQAGWSITLPNGGSYCANTDSDMVKYVQGY